MPDTRHISWPPPAPDRNLLSPYLPGTREFKRRVDALELPNPLTTKPSENAMLQGLLGMAPAFTVYHGTPHKFDKFNVSKIGTGEGAQAYGHGLYFAEDPSVARNYAENLKTVSVGGKDLSPDTLSQSGFLKVDPTSNAAELISRQGYGKTLSDAVAAVKSDPGNPWLAEHLDEVRSLLGKDVKLNSYLLKADIKPSPDKFLDWDKPWSEYKDVLGGTASKVKKSFPGFRDDATVGELYNAYASHRGGNPAAVSEEFSKMGIPGIRYLDRGSRGLLGSGKGTYNYVVFSDRDVSIIK